MYVDLFPSIIAEHNIIIEDNLFKTDYSDKAQQIPVRLLIVTYMVNSG